MNWFVESMYKSLTKLIKFKYMHGNCIFRYGTIMKGMVNEQPVAVKIYSAKQRNIFLNEKDIYLQPFMDTPEILTYFGKLH